MKNKIEDLRDHLFATIESLRDEENPMDIDRAKTIANVASVLVESAKVETQFLEAIGSRGTGSGFIPLEERKPVIPSLTTVKQSVGRI